MQISFHGAAGQVTGSCHMLKIGGTRILVDCGLFQGGREIEEENAEPLGFDPAEVDFLLLTHAHLDHCGRIPLLVRQGFRGEIICTAATRELTRLVLLDAAHLQEEEARHRSRRKARHHHDARDSDPLYETLDALNAFDHFGRTASYMTPLELKPGITATFHDAGHILGSASILLEVKEGPRRQRLLFSGDLGSGGSPLLRTPSPPQGVDVIVMETTYGDRNHRSRADSVAELYDAIGDARRRGGNIVIPTFAMERAQEILFYLRDGVKSEKIDRSIEVFLDSPMAISATEIFRRHPEAFRDDVAKLFAKGGDPFRLDGLHFVRETSESIGLNNIRSGALIMAGSGMCTGGRVRHHLRHNLGHADCSVVFVGYAARGTLARRIIDGAHTVNIYGDTIPVRAKIHTINGFSAHADQSELLGWHRQAGGADLTFLVHGEGDAMESFAGKLSTGRVEQPHMHQTYDL